MKCEDVMLSLSAIHTNANAITSSAPKIIKLTSIDVWWNMMMLCYPEFVGYVFIKIICEQT